MATRAEAAIVISAQDQTSGVMARLEARLQSLAAPALRVQTMFGRTMNLSGLDQMHSRLGQLGQRLGQLPVLGAAFAAGGLAAITGGLVRNAVAAHEAVGTMADLSEKYKVSTQALQVLAEIGADAGVPMESIASGIGKLQEKIAAALGGSKEALQDFADAGINIDQIRADGGQVEKIFARLAGEISSRKDEAANPFKLASSKAILGKGGLDMLPILEMGPEQYAKTLALMREQNRLLEGDVFATADQIDDAWGKTMRNLTGKVRLAGLQMGPALAAVTASLDKLMSPALPATGAQQIELAALQPPAGADQALAVFAKLGDTIGQVAPKFIAAVPKIVNGVDAVLKAIGTAGEYIGWDKLLLGGGLLIAAPFAAGAISVVASMGSIGVALAGVIARIGMLTVVPLVGWLAGTAASLTALGFSGAAAWAMVLGPVVVVGAAIAGLAYLVYDNWDGISSFLSGVWTGFVDGMAPVIPAVDAVIGVVKTVSGWLGHLLGLTGDSRQGLQDWSSAGQLAGNVLAGVFKGVLAPVLAVVDAVKLVAAGIAFLGGSKFEFKSSLAGLLSGDTPNPAPAVQAPAPPVRAAVPRALVPLSEPVLPLVTRGALQPKAPLGSLAPSAGGAGSAAPTALASAARRVDVGGRLDVRITSDGRPQIERVESVNKTFAIDARAGSMY